MSCTVRESTGRFTRTSTDSQVDLQVGLHVDAETDRQMFQTVFLTTAMDCAELVHTSTGQRSSTFYGSTTRNSLLSDCVTRVTQPAHFSYRFVWSGPADFKHRWSGLLGPGRFRANSLAVLQT